jgi:hypothetical protein
MILRVLRLEVFIYSTMFTLQTSFKPLLLWDGGGGEYNPLVEVTVNSKEENSEDFCHDYVQEFGLWPSHCQQRNVYTPT